MREEKSPIPAFLTLTHAGGAKISIREDHILAVRGIDATKPGAQVFIIREQNHEIVVVREDAQAIPGPFAAFSIGENRPLRINIHFIAAVSYSQKHGRTSIIDTHGKDGEWIITDSHDKALQAIQSAWEKLRP